MNLKIESSQVMQKEIQDHLVDGETTAHGVLSPTQSGNEKILLFGRVCSFLGISLVLALLMLELYFLGLLIAAVLCGMAESRGRCGISHIGMIAPWKSIDFKSWVKCCLSYSLSGVVTAYLIGLMIAGVGTWFTLIESKFYLGLIGLVCVLFVLRDLGWLRFNAPQCDRQTYKEWAVTYGLVTGVGMWGAHIGLAVSTVVTYGGLYCLILVAFGFGVGLGEWLLVAFWLGRVVFLWATPWLMQSSPNGMKIGLALENSGSMFRLCSLSGIGCVLILCLAILYKGML